MSLEIFEHQVAGHEQSLFRVVRSRIESTTSTSSNDSKEPTILAKAVGSPEAIEALFYKQAANQCISRFIPKFITIAQCLVPSTGKETSCVLMENVLDGMSNPSIIDVKLGTRLYGREATEAKQLRMEEQARITTSGETGLRICGMKVFHPVEGQYKHYTREYGRSLTVETLLDGFREFFSQVGDSHRQSLIIQQCITQLKEILDVVKATECRLYASSILMAFDGADVRVKLIDFAHSYFCDGDGVDESAIFGLLYLIRILLEL
ncbi:hypothetical protein BDR26DRAFT_838567 [Obelidium mucronatum]|nr:hypothetical protein BDR26DRAFT_838567 [Obelidium mucronatum]